MNARAALLFLSCCLLFACAQRGAAPADALVTYAAALERGDLRSAYGQLSASYRRRMTFEQFRQAVGGTRPEGARALRNGAERSRDRAEVALAGGETASLVREAGLWRLEAPPWMPFDQSTPQAALRAFADAIEGAHWERLVDLAPARYRGEVTSEKVKRYWEGQPAERRRALVSGVRLALERPFIQEGDEAHVVYRGERQIVLVKEDGLWRVENPE